MSRSIRTIAARTCAGVLLSTGLATATVLVPPLAVSAAAAPAAVVGWSPAEAAASRAIATAQQGAVLRRLEPQDGAQIAAAVQAAPRVARAAARAAAQRKLLVQRRAAAARASRAAARARLTPRGIGRAKLTAYGWSSQWSCLNSLWTKESNWTATADNRSSSAYGIPQALPGSKMASAGPDWRTNPATQIEWGLKYIKARYGSPCAAWSHSRATNWY